MRLNNDRENVPFNKLNNIGFEKFTIVPTLYSIMGLSKKKKYTLYKKIIAETKNSALSNTICIGTDEIGWKTTQVLYDKMIIKHFLLAIIALNNHFLENR